MRQGVDLLDLFRPGSGLSFRRLRLLTLYSPLDAWLRQAIREAEEDRSIVDKLRDREAHYASKG